MKCVKISLEIDHIDQIWLKKGEAKTVCVEVANFKLGN